MREEVCIRQWESFSTQKVPVERRVTKTSIERTYRDAETEYSWAIIRFRL